MNILNHSLLGNLEQILASLEIRSSYYIFNDSVYNIKDIRKLIKDPKLDRSSLFVKSMQQTFYRTIHCRNIKFSNESMVFNYNIMREFVEVLSQANTSNGRWENGWEIMEIMDNGKTIKVKNGESIILYQNINQFRIPNEDLEVGKIGSILMPKEMRQISYGFYTLVSNASDDYPNDVTVRIYWNINSTGAKILIKHITTELNRDEIPFQFKTLSNPFNYNRTDAAVLYIKKKYLENCPEKIEKIYAEIKNFIKPDTSLFVKKIYPGIGIAEYVEGNESFGQNRTRIFAEAVLAAKCKFRETKCISEEREDIISYFQNLEIDINKPYLSANSSDIYDQMFNKDS
ncbi:MAG: T3SS effector HopA1 family protein [Nitrososphaeraceae archaeon]